MSVPYIPHPCVTISVVSHKQWELLAPLLSQLDRHCRVHIASVVVTVNLPEHAAIDPSWSLPIRMTCNSAPAGFGANHNAAFQDCRTPWFLVLNPDIRIDCDVLQPLLAAAAQHPGIGLIAPRVQEPDKATPEPYRGLPTPLELVRKRRRDHVPPARAAWIPGMFMLLRDEAFAALGGFDERFFMYCEDVDLCARLRLAGWTIDLLENVHVVHEAQRASNRSARAMSWHLASLARLWTSKPFWQYRRQLQDA